MKVVFIDYEREPEHTGAKGPDNTNTPEVSPMLHFKTATYRYKDVVVDAESQKSTKSPALKIVDLAVDEYKNRKFGSN